MTWGYLIEFAFRDLTARSAIRATLVVVAAVAFAVAFAFTGFGFVYGVERAELSRLTRDPLSTCLWAGDNTLNGRHIHEDDAGKLYAAVLAAVGQPDRVRGVYPIRVVQFNFAMKSGNDTPVTGRTIRLGASADPLPESRPVHAGGRWFNGPDDTGIVVVPSFLASLGYDPEHPPETITLVTSRVRVEVPVRGVMLQELPIRNHSYVLPESYSEGLLHPLETDPSNSTAVSGPVPKGLIDDIDKTGLDQFQATLKAAILNAFPAQEFVVTPTTEGRFTKLSISTRSTSEPPTAAPTLRKSEWETHLKQIAAAVNWPSSDSFVKAKVEPTRSPGLISGDAAAQTGFDLLAVYVNDVLALAPAAKASETYVLSNDRRLVVDRNVVDQVTRVGEQSARYEAGMSIVAGAMSFVFAGMVWFVFRVRAEQQIAEIGMLKAMGMGRLGWLAMIQGLMVGSAGALLGTIVGVVLIEQAAMRLYPDDALAAEAATYRTPQLVASVVAAALVGCMACAWEATRRARTLSPAVAIRTAG